MKVVLYTGGLDSYIGLWLLRKATGEQWIPLQAPREGRDR